MVGDTAVSFERKNIDGNTVVCLYDADGTKVGSVQRAELLNGIAHQERVVGMVWAGILDRAEVESYLNVLRILRDRDQQDVAVVLEQGGERPTFSEGDARN